MVVHFAFLHPSNRVSCSLTSLESSPQFWFWARSSVTGCSRACLFSFRFRFQINSVFFLSSPFLSLSKEFGDGIRSCALRVNRWVLTPKTTVSWLEFKIMCILENRGKKFLYQRSSIQSQCCILRPANNGQSTPIAGLNQLLRHFDFKNIQLNLHLLGKHGGTLECHLFQNQKVPGSNLNKD